MRRILSTLSMLLIVSGCETGINNKTEHNKEVPSGIVDHSKGVTVNYDAMSESSNKSETRRIFSKSAQPGFYLQMAVFEKYSPSKSFLKPLNNSSFNYIVLTHYGKDYVLIGPYKSANEARSHIGSASKYLHKKTFVVEVKRP